MFENIYISIIVVSLIALLTISKQRHEIIALLVYYAIGVAMYFIIDVESYNSYYVIMCISSLSLAVVIQDEFKFAALCSYLLIPINILGYFLWYKYYPHDLYSVLASCLLIIQFLSILPKAILNGTTRTNTNNYRYFMDVSGGFVGNKECDTINNTSQSEKI
ncbi:MAG: hypothetical protein COA43_14500 [Robiginitomaculum sp.]|nr:MAG: hypothetical protein COA43_14500 [Robiginitomaculum sp.]